MHLECGSIQSAWSKSEVQQEGPKTTKQLQKLLYPHHIRVEQGLYLQVGIARMNDEGKMERPHAEADLLGSAPPLPNTTDQFTGRFLGKDLSCDSYKHPAHTIALLSFLFTAGVLAHPWALFHLYQFADDFADDFADG